MFAKIKELLCHINEYIDTRVKILKLTAAEKSSKFVATLIAGIIVALIFFLFIVFLSIALAVFLGGWIGKLWIGYLIVAVLYLLGLIIWSAKEKMIRLPILNAILKQLFKMKMKIRVKVDKNKIAIK